MNWGVGGGAERDEERERAGGGRKRGKQRERKPKPLLAAEIIQLHFCSDKIIGKSCGNLIHHLGSSHPVKHGVNSEMRRENIIISSTM